MVQSLGHTEKERGNIDKRDSLAILSALGQTIPWRPVRRPNLRTR